MWSGLFTLLFLSLSLAVSSYLAGSVPLFISLNQRHTRLLTACGTGILVGTALIVIIPEGVETLYSARPSASHAHGKREIHALSHPNVEQSGYRDRLSERTAANDASTSFVTIDRREQDKTVVPNPKKGGSDHGKSQEKEHKDSKSSKPKESKSGGGGSRSGSKVDLDHAVGNAKDFEPHAWIGLSIITGFVLMYLIDKLPKLAPPRSSIRPSYISLQGMGIRSNSDAEDDAGLQQSHRTEDIKPTSTTTGLVIHATADGIALGASSTAATQRLSFIIFVALMIHKAPAAFGLTAVLLKQGLSKRQARAHLAVFALAAPVGALVTWVFAHLIGGGSLGRESSTVFITGLLLLFSGGTFLYVAMHTMQDTGHESSPEHDTGTNGFGDVYQPQQAKQEERPTLVDTLATVGGMLLPLLTLFGHHSH